MAYRLLAGIAQRDEPIAKDLLIGLEENAQFLSMPHTRKWYRIEHTFPKIVDRDTYDYWVSLGGKSAEDRAREEVTRILRERKFNLSFAKSCSPMLRPMVFLLYLKLSSND